MVKSSFTIIIMSLISFIITIQSIIVKINQNEFIYLLINMKYNHFIKTFLNYSCPLFFLKNVFSSL
jgi:hypothetical protein